MINHITWNKAGNREPLSPFTRGNIERPLRITFHTSSLAGATGQEKEALELLMELAFVSDIQAMQTQPGSFPFFQISPTKKDGFIPVTVNYSTGTAYAMIPNPQQWTQIAASLLKKHDQHPAVIEMLDDLLLSQAHYRLHQDIFITLSPQLLTHRAQYFVRDANPMTPSEAAKIVGYFLRSRDKFIYEAWSEGTASLDQGFFFLVLTRHRLPNLWRYFSACVGSQPMRGDDIRHLGRSIITRCVRALEARDAIAFTLFDPQKNNRLDTIMYHFDYLTLLLVGAFDVEVRIAHRVYHIHRPNERFASFRKAVFQNALGKAGASTLHDLITRKHFQDVMILLHELRNTIHGSVLELTGFSKAGKPDLHSIALPSDEGQRIWETAERLSTPDRWGLFWSFDKVYLEPFKFANTLINECFQLIDEVAAATDVMRLFPSGSANLNLTEFHAEHWAFNEEIRKRFDLLG